MFKVLGIDHIVLRISERERALAFYCGFLGCEVEREVPEAGLIQLRAGNSLIDLVPLDGKLGAAGGAPPGKEGRNVDHFCLRIEPFEVKDLFQKLESAGIATAEVARRYGADGFGQSIYITDPDGNVVELKGPPEDGPFS